MTIAAEISLFFFGRGCLAVYIAQSVFEISLFQKVRISVINILLTYDK
jgi:hypothetical protein